MPFQRIRTDPQAFFTEEKRAGGAEQFAMLGGNLALASLLAARWVESGHFPLSNMYESLLFLAWGITGVHLYVTERDGFSKSAVPGALEKKFVKAASWFASKGVKGGSKKRLSLDDGTFFVNNHLRFTVLLHSDVDTKSSRIVGFEVAPVSVRHDFNGAWNELDPKLSSCSALNHPSVVFEDSGKTKPRDPKTVPPQRVEEGASIVFTYDVAFRESPVKWASRWDVYLQMADGKGVHWFSVVNSCLVVLFLSAMVAMIIVRLLKRDISKYNALETIEEAQEESGWKLVHGDVFRAPAHATSLALLVGTGTQLLFMTFVVMVFAVAGFLSPANRGGLMTAALTLFALAGFANGYASGRLCKLFGVTGGVRGDVAAWRRNALAAALFAPGVAFCVFFTLNLLCWEERSAGAAPFTALLSVCALWFLVHAPLVFLGAYAGEKKEAPEQPTRTNKIPRRVPPQPWYLRGAVTALAGGALPFAAVFIELFFILSSIWHHQVYYVFGILFLVVCIALVTCAEVSVVLCYFQLCAEDYEWWWRAVANSGTSALYVFLYSAWYFFANLEISRAVPSIMYFAYMALVSAGFAAVTGAVGFLACFAFCRAIYGSVKID